RFDAELFAENLVRCKVNFITWCARCNQGNAYYNTKFGYKHPALKRDLLKEVIDSCHKRGIAVSAYFNGGLSDEEFIHHPEWCRTAPEGHHYMPNRVSVENRAACYSSPAYREHLFNMAREVLVDYKADGIFLDCMGFYYTCVCPHCVEEMRKKGLDWQNPDHHFIHTKEAIISFGRELHKVVKECNKDARFFMNGALMEPMIGYNTQMECECLPTTKELGYDYLPVQAHFLRTIAGGNEVLNMTGRFYNWGDFGGLRKEEGLEYDLLYGMANGMVPEVGGHFHPRGDMDQPVFDLLEKVYGTLQTYEEWTEGAVNTPEVGIVANDGVELRDSHIMKSAVRMLTELKYQCDAITPSSAGWEKYKVLIFADRVIFTEEILAKVRAHLAKGGKIIATGKSGIAPDGKSFPLEGWPLAEPGEGKYDPLYFHPEGRFAQGLQDMPLSLYAKGISAAPAPGAAMEMRCVKAFFNKGFDGIRTSWYCPPEGKTSTPFIAVKGNIVCITGNFFEGYYNRCPYQLKLLMGNIMNDLLPDPVFKHENLPSFARVFVQKKDGNNLVHLLAYTPELRGAAIALEEKSYLVDSRISLYTGEGKVKKVRSCPDGEEFAFSVENGYCSVTIPLIHGYKLLSFEME
ncbi:MAG: alpha-L-fucosidase, partial [Lentisphaeria bacterium]|nr:alpha-L-fucosidase [Lentisphaeria bacterium]